MNKYKYILLGNNKVLFIIFIFISLFIFFIFPHEVFAMESSDLWVTNYYGDKEYVGSNTYSHFHPDPAPDIDAIQSKVSAPYGPSSLNQDDWYADKKDTDYMHSTNSIPNKYSNLYYSIKRVSFYYLWKIHSNDYTGYKDFKKSWDPSKSIRKEILKDIKFEFKNKSK